MLYVKFVATALAILLSLFLAVMGVSNDDIIAGILSVCIFVFALYESIITANTIHCMHIAKKLRIVIKEVDNDN